MDRYPARSVIQATGLTFLEFFSSSEEMDSLDPQKIFIRRQIMDGFNIEAGERFEFFLGPSKVVAKKLRYSRSPSGSEWFSFYIEDEKTTVMDGSNCYRVEARTAVAARLRGLIRGLSERRFAVAPVSFLTIFAYQNLRGASLNSRLLGCQIYLKGTL